jgi:periplasmic copper chaperone A
MKSLAALLAVTLLATPAMAAGPGVQVQAAWSRPAAAGGTGAGFMTLSNPTRKADALVAVESPLARTVEIHRSAVGGAMASMQKLPRIEVPAGGTVTLGPGGYHLMFLGLTRPLKVGDVLPATLTFASGAKLKATFKVGLAASAAEHAHH